MTFYMGKDCVCGHFFIGKKIKGACSKCYARIEGKKLN